jgi:hypothetical protein
MAANSFGKFQCPCCGFYTFDEDVDDTYDICSVCFWEDSGLQLRDPDYAGGANKVSLNQAKLNFKNFGASDEESIKYVRPPLEEEK